jgi:hypothetical protein
VRFLEEVLEHAKLTKHVVEGTEDTILPPLPTFLAENGDLASQALYRRILANVWK